MIWENLQKRLANFGWESSVLSGTSSRCATRLERESLVAKLSVDTAENGPFKIWQSSYRVPTKSRYQGVPNRRRWYHQGTSFTRYHGAWGYANTGEIVSGSSGCSSGFTGIAQSWKVRSARDRTIRTIRTIRTMRILSKFGNFPQKIQKFRKISTFSKLSAKFRQNFIKIWAKITENNSK